MNKLPALVLNILAQFVNNREIYPRKAYADKDFGSPEAMFDYLCRSVTTPQTSLINNHTHTEIWDLIQKSKNEHGDSSILFEYLSEVIYTPELSDAGKENVYFRILDFINQYASFYEGHLYFQDCKPTRCFLHSVDLFETLDKHCGISQSEEVALKDTIEELWNNYGAGLFTLLDEYIKQDDIRPEDPTKWIEFTSKLIKRVAIQYVDKEPKKEETTPEQFDVKGVRDECMIHPAYHALANHEMDIGYREQILDIMRKTPLEVLESGLFDSGIIRKIKTAGSPALQYTVLSNEFHHKYGRYAKMLEEKKDAGINQETPEERKPEMNEQDKINIFRSFLRFMQNELTNDAVSDLKTAMEILEGKFTVTEFWEYMKEHAPTGLRHQFRTDSLADELSSHVENMFSVQRMRSTYLNDDIGVKGKNLNSSESKLGCQCPRCKMEGMVKEMMEPTKGLNPGFLKVNDPDFRNAVFGAMSSELKERLSYQDIYFLDSIMEPGMVQEKEMNPIKMLADKIIEGEVDYPETLRRLQDIADNCIGGVSIKDLLLVIAKKQGVIDIEKAIFDELKGSDFGSVLKYKINLIRHMKGVVNAENNKRKLETLRKELMEAIREAINHAQKTFQITNIKCVVECIKLDDGNFAGNLSTHIDTNDMIPQIVSTFVLVRSKNGPVGTVTEWATNDFIYDPNVSEAVINHIFKDQI